MPFETPRRSRVPRHAVARMLQHAHETSPDLVHVLRSDGSFAYANAHWLRLLGYSDADLDTLTLFDVVPEEHHAHCLALLARIRDRQDVGLFEVEFRDTQGRRLWLEGYSRVYEDGDERLTVGVFRDVSERRRLADALRTAEERWHLALLGSQDGVWDWDVLSGRVYYSPRWEAMFGYEPGSAPQTLDAFTPLVHPDDIDAMFSEVQRHLRGETAVYSHEFRMRHLTGTPMWTRHRATAQFDPNGRAIRMVGTTMDVTAYRTLQAQLRESETRARATIAALPDLVFTFDREGRFLDAQASDPTQLLVPPDALIGRTIREVLPPPVADLALAALARVLDDQGLQSFTYSLGLPSGMQVFEFRMVRMGAQEALGLARNITASRAAADALRTSEEQLRITFDAIGDAVLVTDRFGLIIDMNPVAERLTGWSKRDAVGQRAEAVFRIINETTREPAALPVDEVLATGQIHGLANHTALIARDGTERSIADSAAPVRDRDGHVTGVVLVFRDVTDERQLEAARQQVHEQLEAAVAERTAELSGLASMLQATFEATADGLLVVDRHGKVTGANRRFFQMWRIPDAIADTRDDEALLSAVVHQLSHPDDFLREVRRLYDNPAMESHDTLLFADGRVFERYSRPQVISGSIVGRVWSFRDVSESVCHLRTIEDRERLLSESQRVANVGSWTVDVDGRSAAAVWTDETYRLFGVTRDFVPALASILALVHPDDRAAVHRLLAGDTDSAEFRVSLPDGTHRTLYGQGATVHDPDGRASHLVGTVQDVTRLRSLELQLRHSQKMEAIGRLAGGVAHDFNNLLTVILGTIELSLLERAQGDALHNDWMEARRAGVRAADLTRQLLAFSRKQVLQPHVMDLNALVGRLLTMISRLIGETIRVSFVPDRTIAPVRADPGQLEQVVVNLAVNARDAMPRGGALTFTTAMIVLDAPHAAAERGLPCGRYVALQVSDTGVGMDEATMRMIFEPFFTTKPVGHGTGLGLSTVDGIVRQSGGAIWVESTVGAGSTFSIVLPAVSDAIAITRESHPAPQGLERGTESILVVEDEPGVRRFAARVLAAAGYRVLVAATGERALDMLAREPTPVHLLLTDVIMPGLNGGELACRVQALSPSTRVVFTSGYTDDAIAQHHVLEKGAHFLGKPYSATDLTERIRAVLDLPIDKPT